MQDQFVEIISGMSSPGRGQTDGVECSLDLLTLERSGGQVSTVVLALDFFLDLFHLLGLSLPLCFAYFGGLVEKFVVRFAIASTHSVPQGGELSIVVVKVQTICR